MSDSQFAIRIDYDKVADSELPVAIAKSKAKRESICSIEIDPLTSPPE
jgi:hypothetical protein